MWEFMNGMANGVRRRMMPRQRGIGTMTAMVIGASVGIAAWEAVRRAQPVSKMMSNNGSPDTSEIAQQVLDSLETT